MKKYFLGNHLLDFLLRTLGDFLLTNMKILIQFVVVSIRRRENLLIFTS